MASNKVAKKEQLAQARAQKLASGDVSLESISGASMTTKKEAKEKQLAQARAQILARSSTVLGQSNQSLPLEFEEKLTEIDILKTNLNAEKQKSAQLFELWNQTKNDAAILGEMLSTEQAYSKELYSMLRVERRARQRGQKRNDTLEKWIKILKSENLQKYEDLKRLTSVASQSVDALLKVEDDKTILQKELMSALEWCTTEIVESQKKLKESQERLKSSCILVQRLQKENAQVKNLRDKAVKRAKDQVYKEKSAYRLLHKGVYTESTRNIIRLLVQSGCSREHVSKVIHAVFKIAGISVHGDISRCTVSRVIQWPKKPFQC